jgi:hypothetical protein
VPFDEAHRKEANHTTPTAHGSLIVPVLPLALVGLEDDGADDVVGVVELNTANITSISVACDPPTAVEVSLGISVMLFNPLGVGGDPIGMLVMFHQSYKV